MNRLISLEPSNTVAIRIEPGHKCLGLLTLRNVMHTMPVAFQLNPVNKARYSVSPPSAIIPPLRTLTLEIVYHHPPNSPFPPAPDSRFPYSDDSFLLHSVVVPGADLRDCHDFLVPPDWFTSKKKQVFSDSAIRLIFVGSAVLSRLVSDGAMDDVREVLERSDPTWEAADSVASDGRPLLHIAISRRRPDLVQLILEFGPDIEARSRYSGLSPLEAACEAGEALIAELLLARRASTETSGGPWTDHGSSARTPGPIHLATANGHLEVLKLLIVKGANVNALTNDGLTALHFAAVERRRDCARLLLGNGAWTDVRGGVHGDTPLHIAAAHGDESMVKILLHKGANKDVRNNAGKTAYDVAAENGQVRLYDALRLGDRLCSAAKRGEARAVSRLLESGAVLNGRDQNGWTALHRACFYGRVETVRLLVERGADVEAKDEEGYTALHCAAEAGQGEVVDVLVKKGVDMEARTNKGATAVRMAEALGYGGIVRMLGHGGESDKKKRVLSGSGRSPMPLASVL